MAQVFECKQDHHPASDMKKRSGKFWNEYFKWCFVRNPWDMLVSKYHFRKKQKMDEFKQKQLLFAEWLDFALTCSYHLTKQYLWIKTNGQIELDFIGRFENLRNDFQFVSQKVGLNKELPHVNKTRHDHYSMYYTSKMVDKVRKECCEDIRLFGYEFERNHIQLL